MENTISFCADRVRSSPIGLGKADQGFAEDSRARVLLYFLNTPIKIRSNGTPEWIKCPTTRLMAMLLVSLRQEVESGRVIIGVETVPLQSALCKVAGIPVHYLPQPVESSTDHWITDF